MVGKMAWAYMGMTNQSSRGTFEGVFNRESTQLNDFNMTDAGAWNEKPSYIGFDASNSSAIYAGSSVQVSALQTLVCIKI